MWLKKTYIIVTLKKQTLNILIKNSPNENKFGHKESN